MKTLLLVIVFVAMTVTTYAAESVYTKLDLDKDCTWHSEYEQGASAYCQGYKGYPVHFSEGDLRQMVRFGHLAKLDGQWESFGQFNQINDTIEWRIKDKIPFATILRWFIEHPGQNGAISKELEGQILVVSKVASHESPTACVVGYVDARANVNANELAREIADELAASFICGDETAKYKGAIGPHVGTHTSHFE